jgi:hypothetical protein
LNVTSDAARDLAAGRNDPVFFAKRWLGIELHAGQRAWVEGIAARDESGWRPKYLTTVCSAGNRAGKTLGMAVAVFHSAFYKLGIQPPDGTEKDAMRWQTAPYEWYHVGIQQETAELVHREISMILEGGHPAQRGRGCPLISEIGKVVDHTKKYRGEYLWLQLHPLVGGANVHFRTTQDKAKALLGKDMNGISFDEAAFEPHLMQIYQEVLNLRRLSTGGQLHFIGTPTEGINDYADLWDMGNPTRVDRDPQVFSFRLSTRDNVGYGLTPDTFEAIIRQQSDYLIAQNIDGFFIEAKDSYFSSEAIEACFLDIPEEEQPKVRRRYVQGVDPGIASDSTWAIILDYTDPNKITGVRARSRSGKQTIQAVVNMVRENHLLFNQDSSCLTIVDETGFGGKLFKQEFSVIRPIRGYDFGGTKAKKLDILSDLRAALDKRRLVFPKTGVWLRLRRQLLSYKLDDKKLEQDAVMALAVALRHAIRNNGQALDNPSFLYFGGSD